MHFCGCLVGYGATCNFCDKVIPLNTHHTLQVLYQPLINACMSSVKLKYIKLCKSDHLFNFHQYTGKIKIHPKLSLSSWSGHPMAKVYINRQILMSLILTWIKLKLSSTKYIKLPCSSDWHHKATQYCPCLSITGHPEWIKYQGTPE